MPSQENKLYLAVRALSPQTKPRVFRTREAAREFVRDEHAKNDRRTNKQSWSVYPAIWGPDNERG